MPLTPADVGRRVVIRHRIDPPVGTAAATDVLGELVEWAGGRLVVRTKAGDTVSVPEGDVIVAKVIPRRTVTRREVRDLEAAAAAGWRGSEVAALGGWLLRAAAGFTGRANSCLPLSEPGFALGEAVDRVERWYRDRGLPPAFQVPTLLGRPLEAELDRRGWPPPPEDVLVMTAPLPVVGGGHRPGLAAVTVTAEPDDAWLTAYHYRGGDLPTNASPVLLNADPVGFASVDDNGGRVAIARGAVTDAPSGRRWLGITAVEVDPGARRRGLASHVMAGLAQWGLVHGATDCYVQVAGGNSGALELYERLGFDEHHRYHYRRLPLP
jgi:N-acetylglutamate synthase